MADAERNPTYLRDLAGHVAAFRARRAPALTGCVIGVVNLNGQRKRRRPNSGVAHPQRLVVTVTSGGRTYVSKPIFTPMLSEGAP